MKSSTNPGGVGHTWVKDRFIDIGQPNTIHNFKEGSRMFIPSLVQDNMFLLASDPEYVKRLDNLPEKERRALKFGDWDIFDGQFFGEFRRDLHVIEPFTIPQHWNRYVALDYGIDMFAPLFIAVDAQCNAYVYDELYKSELIIREAAQRLKSRHEKFRSIYAPPDLWNRRQETGRSAFDIFYENGVLLQKCSADRVNGWLAVKEYLKPYKIRDEHTGEIRETAKLKIFSTCKNLIRCLPAVQHDDKNPNDVSKEPHELTHITDALRYFCISRPQKSITDRKILQNNLYNEFHINTNIVRQDYGSDIVVI